MLPIVRRRHTALSIPALALACLLAATSLVAQQPDTSIATGVPKSAVYPAGAADTVETVRVARATDSVRTERDRLLGERRDAEARWTSVRDQGARLRASMAQVRDAIGAASAREKLARKDKRDSVRAVAVSERVALERSLLLLQARIAVREAEVEEARISREFLDAAIRADDAELLISERRDQVLPDDPTQRPAFQELTSRWLQALRTRAARSYDLEDRRYKVVEAQITLLKRQRD